MVATPGRTYEITVGPVTTKLAFSPSSKYFGENVIPGITFFDSHKGSSAIRIDYWKIKPLTFL
jgi:hypothetical protein